MASFSQVAILYFLAATTAAQYGAIPAPAGLSPRYVLGALARLEERQGGGCAANAHSCMDINSNACCLNTQYCYIDPEDSIKCCAIGSICDNECAASQYRCGETAAVVSGTTTLTASCCERTCTTAGAFLCGSNCCNSGASCSDGQCKTPSTSTIIVQIPSSTNGTPAERTGSQATAESTTGNSGLSPVAKAGIGVGISVIFLLMGGAILWFCIVQRRMIQQSESSSIEPAMSEVTKNRRPSTTRQMNGPLGPDATKGPYTSDDSQGTSSMASNYDRGVPLNPQSPGDITAPVELEAATHKKSPKSNGIIIHCTELS